MSRQNFTKAILVARFKLCGGRCENVIDGKRCNAVLVPGRWHGDHDLADQLGGKPTLENARCLCAPCHVGIKTPADVEKIARAKRQEAIALGAKAPPARPIQGRPFPGKKPKRQPRPALPRVNRFYAPRTP